MKKLQFPNNKIMKLWLKHFGKESRKVYLPLFYPKFKKGGLLFIGLNPSFSSRGFRNMLKGSKYENIRPEHYFKFTDISLKKVNTVIEVEKLAIEKYDYFTKLKILAHDINLPWQHIDLFFERETDQKFIKLQNIEKSGLLSAFAREQFDISLEVIKFVNPKVVVVINALASAIIKRELSDKLCFYDDIGTYRLKLNSAEPIIFFSGMLSGQRALDNYSFERLRWHLKFAIKKNKK